jgi:hypothetical protein
MSGRRLVALPVTALLTVLAILAVVAAPATQRPSSTGSTLDSGDELLAAVGPDHREAVAREAVTMPRYTIAATLMLPSQAAESHVASAPEATPPATPIATPQASPGPSPQATPVASMGEPANAAGSEPPADAEPQVVGTLDLHYVNTTGEPLDELYIRLYPNLRQYGSGRMVIDNVAVDGEPVEVHPPALHSVPDATPISIDNAGARDLAIVRIPLSASLAPDESTSVRMDFSTTVPIDPPDENGLFRYTPATGTWTLAHWFPMLAGYDPEHGWEIDPPAAWSDITFANTALFDLTLTAPEGLVLVTTGVEVDVTEGDGSRTARITTGPVRDVAIIADPELTSTSTDVAGTTIMSWHRPGEEAGSETILQWAAQSFEIFTELFGPYPYTTLDLVSVPGLIGHELPQLVLVGSDVYPDPETLGSRTGAIEFLVAHQVAHQWWYGLVGSNPHAHAFLDEGLAEYSTIVYFERQHGEEVAASHLRDGLIHSYALMLVTTGDQVADQPTVAFPDASAYYATVYRKAGLGFATIRQEIGDEAFFSALRAYAEDHRFEVATPDDLLAAFEAASGQELDAIWSLWFESDRGRVEIVMDPLPAPAAPATPAASPAASPVASPVVTAPAATPVGAVPGMATPLAATPQASPVAAD